jgi:hypothetical protein
MVSNRGMRQTIPCLLFLLLTFCLWAQGPPADKTEMDAIRRIEMLPVSSLDRNLPKVTLEFFLKYEGGGAPIKWQVIECNEHAGDTVVNPKHDTAMCVVAEIKLKDERAATVLVSVGTFKRGPVDVPAVYGVRVTYPFGPTHSLLRLSDLPAELHHPLPKGPKDLLPPVSALLTLSPEIVASQT